MTMRSRGGDDNGGKEYYIELDCFSTSLNKMVWREREKEEEIKRDENFIA